jgi:glycosyltransferase involved in cell wall biosynthesis
MIHASAASKTIFIVHPGKANYPEIAAYASYFGGLGFHVMSGSKWDYAKIPKDVRKRTVVWCIMGFYPTKFDARLVIHDYRSLSVGRCASLKDRVKRHLQPTPALRIFQTAEMEKMMGFSGNGKSVILPMGVPDWIFSMNEDAISDDVPSATFCYIGEISRERGFDSFLDGFCRFRRSDETLILVGDAERCIVERFEGAPGVTFTGRLPQRNALAVVRKSRFAVSTIPSVRPYNVQAPTKLLEYAALGKPIVCNDSRSNIDVINKFGINCLITGPTIFDRLDRERLISSLPNDPGKLHMLRWNEIIRRADIESMF